MSYIPANVSIIMNIIEIEVCAAMTALIIMINVW